MKRNINVDGRGLDCDLSLRYTLTVVNCAVEIEQWRTSLHDSLLE